MLDLVLIHPPVTLATEPPLGINLLAAELRSCGLKVATIDANICGLDHLLRSAISMDMFPSPHQQRMQYRQARAIQQLRGSFGYENLDRYRRAVYDLEQALKQVPQGDSVIQVGLASYHDHLLSPLSTRDLLTSAQEFGRSPFADYFYQLTQQIAADSPRMVGLSVNYLHQALPAMALAGVLRSSLPQLPILLGGGLLSCWKGRLNEDQLRPYIDHICFGDGIHLVMRLLNPDHALSTPTYHQLPDYTDMPWDLYWAPKRVFPFASSRGCFWRQCRYCPEALAEPTFHPIPPRRVPLLLDDRQFRHHADVVHFTDSAIPPTTLAHLAAQRWSLRWYGFTRFTPALTQASFCQDLRRSGCLMLQLGLESGSPRILANLQKGIDLPQAAQALQQLAEAGIAVYLYVMFGMPAETRDDALQTLEFVVTYAPYIRYLNTSLFNLPISSPPEAELTYVPFRGEHNNLALYTGFRQPNGWDRRAARLFLEREFARHPAIAPILARVPPVFGPNHAIFLNPKLTVSSWRGQK